MSKKERKLTYFGNLNLKQLSSLFMVIKFITNSLIKRANKNDINAVK